LEDYELEEFFEDTMNNEFNSILDDGSALITGRLLLGYRKFMLEGRYAEIENDLNVRYPHATNLSIQSSIKQKNDDVNLFCLSFLF
jgi:hypothetical protein